LKISWAFINPFPFFMKIRIMAVFGLGLSLSAAQAQTTFSIGPRVGGGVASGTFTGFDQLTTTPKAGDYTYSRSSVAGYQLGLTASIGSGHLAFQPSLLYTSKGVKQLGSASDNSNGVQSKITLDVTSRINYLELPLNVVYSLGDDGQGFQLFAGPYVAFGIGGKADYKLDASSNGPGIPFSDSGSRSYEFGNTFVDPDPNGTSTKFVADARARRFDAGLNAGVGYRVGPVQAQLGYGLGLVNVQPDYPASYKQDNSTGYNRSVQLSVAYLFSAGGR